MEIPRQSAGIDTARYFSESAGIAHILKTISLSTGLRCAAVGCFIHDKWKICAIRDELGFNVEPGFELPFLETLCNEVRLSKTPIVIKDVRTDNRYKTHPVPQKWGYVSMVSYPIILGDDEVVGTLCGFNNESTPLNNDDIRMFEFFAGMFAYDLAKSSSTQQE